MHALPHGFDRAGLQRGVLVRALILLKSNKIGMNPLPTAFIASARTEEECLRPLTVGQLLGKGFFGSVSEACSQAGVCDQFVVKIIENQPNSQGVDVLGLAVKEARLLKQITELGDRLGRRIAPRFRKACIIPGVVTAQRVAIIMERAGRSLWTNLYVTNGNILQLMNILALLHENGVYQLDVKWDNILMMNTDVLLADFGIAKRCPDPRSEEATTLATSDWNQLATGLIINQIPVPFALLDLVNVAKVTTQVNNLNLQAKSAVRIDPNRLDLLTAPAVPGEGRVEFDAAQINRGWILRFKGFRGF